MIPKKKFMRIGKLCILFLVIAWVLTSEKPEKWFRNEKKTTVGTTDVILANDYQWEREILNDEARIVPGMGENGTLIEVFNDLAIHSIKENGVNIYFSEQISYERTLRDFRNPDCLNEVYDAELPSTSIVIVFHNEFYSIMLRMLWGIVNSVKRDNPVYQNANFIDKKTGKTMQLGYKGQSKDSEVLYVKEIILVDDNSTKSELKEKLEYYVKTRFPKGLIRIIRLPEQYGLIRAKVEGARNATGEVLVFLDAHCEVQIDWLRPLLQNLKHNATSVVFPILDSIDPLDFSYNVMDRREFQVGGFDMYGVFKHIHVPERELKRRGSDIAPTFSPTMAGGLFAIRHSYFWYLGAYDEKMTLFGAENLEFSFRIWMCGGILAAVPCSRVGHVKTMHRLTLKQVFSYSLNLARMAKVWMDEYAESFFILNQDLEFYPKVGNVTERVNLRKKLRCKSFRWYIGNIYKEKYVPGADSVAFGRFINPYTGLCVYNLDAELNDTFPLLMYLCRSRWKYAQVLSLTKSGQLRTENYCVYIELLRKTLIPLRPLTPCHNEMVAVLRSCRPSTEKQEWRYLPKTRQILNVETNLCLESPNEIVSQVRAKECNDTKLAQTWYIEYSDESFDYEHTVKPISQEKYLKLAKLTGHRMVQIDIRKYMFITENKENSTSRFPNTSFNVTGKSYEYLKKINIRSAFLNEIADEDELRKLGMVEPREDKFVDILDPDTIYY